MSDFPLAGQVFEYHYLWNRKAKQSKLEGRKKRPTCMTIVIVNKKEQHVLFIAAITTKSPMGGTMPRNRKQRLWSDEEKRSICVQRGGAGGVGCQGVTRQFSMNSTPIFKWLRNTRFEGSSL